MGSTAVPVGLWRSLWCPTSFRRFRRPLPAWRNGSPSTWTCSSASGCASSFEPVERHVTLSTQAGVNKPDRRIYELALTRLGTDATLGDCLSITENAEHVAACRALGMQALQFGVAFTDWSQAPQLVRSLIDPADS